MEKENWGIKRICLSCGTRFYDFNISSIICPSCNATFDPEYICKRKTKSSQEKIDDIDPVGIDLTDETLADDGDIESIDEDEDDLIEETKE